MGLRFQLLVSLRVLMLVSTRWIDYALVYVYAFALNLYYMSWFADQLPFWLGAKYFHIRESISCPVL